MSERAHYYDSALFWLPFGAAAAVIGGIFTAIGANRVTAGASLLSDLSFDGGLALVVVGVVLLVWSLALFLAHRHIASHVSSGSGLHVTMDQHVRDVRMAANPVSSGPEKLRLDLAQNLEAVKDFYAELETVMGPRPEHKVTEEDAVAITLLRLVAERLGDIPLRRSELLAVVHVLREAISNVDDSPFAHDSESQDILPTGEVRDDRLWQIQLTTAGAYAQGIIRSDGTYATLRDLYFKLNDLRKEVHRLYHPPAMPPQHG